MEGIWFKVRTLLCKIKHFFLMLVGL